VAKNATTPGGISYEELAGFPQFSGSRDSRKITTRWRIAWSDIEPLFAECFPEPVVGAGWNFQVPMTYPGYSYLYAQDLQIEPLGGDGATVVWDAVARANSYPTDAVASLTFGTVQWEHNDPSGGTNLTIRTTDVSIGGEFLRIPQWKMSWQDSGDAVVEEDIDLGKFIPSIEYSITLHYAPSLNLATIVDKIGKVNSTNDVLSHVADETLLYLGASANRTTTWKITHRFSERVVKQGSNEYGWNHFYRPSDQTWQRAVHADTNELVFPTATLIELYQP
jgi:hypothetical protein